MYRPPLSPGIIRVEQHHRAPDREIDIVRRQHREHIAAERAKRREERLAAQPAGRRIANPVAALWAMMHPHGHH
jgi:hypothetical protein